MVDFGYLLKFQIYIIEYLSICLKGGPQLTGNLTDKCSIVDVTPCPSEKVTYKSPKENFQLLRLILNFTKAAVVYTNPVDKEKFGFDFTFLTTAKKVSEDSFTFKK